MNYTLARNVILYDELGKILPVFNSAGIEVIVLAGAALGATVYDDIGQRPMGDIDLLIRHRDKQAIGELLATLGYVLDTARSDEAHYSKTLDSFTLHIDCHTDLRHYLDDRELAGVWNRARPARYTLNAPLSEAMVGSTPKAAHREARSTLILSPEDSFIYTAVDSAIYHGRITDNTINDIKLIIKHYFCHEDTKTQSDYCHPEPFALCHSEGAKRPKNPAHGKLREGSLSEEILRYAQNDSLVPKFILPPVRASLAKGGSGTNVCLSGSIDWSIVIKRIKSYRLETPLYILFDLCRREGISIPDEVMSSLHPRKRSLEYMAYRLLLASGIRYLESHDDATRVARFLTRPHARWELFMNSFMPSLHFIRQRYDLNGSVQATDNTVYSILYTLYYPLRFLSLLWRMNKAIYQLTMRMM